MTESVPARALELFDGGLYCAESVLQAMCEAREIRDALVPRLATGLCAGIARTGGMCGAVSGAILGIGLVAGRNSGDQPIEPAFALVRSLTSGFEARHGSTGCTDLIECDLDTEEGQRVFVEERRVERCRRFVEDAARMAEELLAQSP